MVASHAEVTAQHSFVVSLACGDDVQCTEDAGGLLRVQAKTQLVQHMKVILLRTLNCWFDDSMSSFGDDWIVIRQVYTVFLVYPFGRGILQQRWC